MKKLFNSSLLLVAIIIAGTQLASAQAGFVTLSHQGTSSFYKTINAALTAAADNDTMYIPGSSFTESLTLNKKLVIYGAGFHPDSTKASGMTEIFGSINVYAGASGSHLEGFYLSSSINYYSGENIDNFQIKRCNFGSGSFRNSSTGCNGLIISESVVRGALSGDANLDNVLVEKSIIQGSITYFSNTVRFEHNILLSKGSSSSPSSNSFANCSGNDVVSNIILSTYINIPADCTFSKNVFVSSPSFSTPDNYNVVGASITAIFVNLESGKEYIFDYANDYHLADGSPAIGIAGDTGDPLTDAGIFDAANPFKPGAVPSTPHVFKTEVASENDANGLLNVKIGVAAQER